MRDLVKFLQMKKSNSKKCPLSFIEHLTVPNGLGVSGTDVTERQND